MISRLPGYTPTRSRAAVHDETLAQCGSDKSKILSAIVYITDITRKDEMNRAWDDWVDRKNPPMRACIGVDLEPPHIVEIVVTAAK
ncbi:Rid family hydrolase [Bradyrhizobium sp.]|uniref:Rid family hydrolase n=1 Tax=Bradyrhizobium sp. TaxID=376 RepID=UPI0025C03484|nr:Rid family hydrolase [Bradyrhizobium sp.]